MTPLYLSVQNKWICLGTGAVGKDDVIRSNGVIDIDSMLHPADSLFSRFTGSAESLSLVVLHCQVPCSYR